MNIEAIAHEIWGKLKGPRGCRKDDYSLGNWTVEHRSLPYPKTTVSRDFRDIRENYMWGISPEVEDDDFPELLENAILEADTKLLNEYEEKYSEFGLTAQLYHNEKKWITFQVSM